MTVWSDRKPTPEELEPIRALAASLCAHYQATLKPLTQVAFGAAIPTAAWQAIAASGAQQALQQALESIRAAYTPQLQSTLQNLTESIRAAYTPQLQSTLQNLTSNLIPNVPRVEGLLQPIRDLAASVVERWRQGFVGDVLLLHKGEGAEAEREAALRRLAAYFTCGRVFHPQRWRLLEPAFAAYCREAEQSPAEAWDSLVMTALLMACADLPGDVPLGQLYDHLRREVRPEIERALLDGQTLAEYMHRPEAAWPESEEPRAVEDLGAAASLTLEQMIMLERLRPLLECLTERELRALLDGAKDPAARVARSRAKKKVLAALALAM